jgi:phytanoyl-CoA hydroxylase
MITKKQLDQFGRDGFLNAGPVLTPGEVDELSRELDRIIAIGPEGFRPSDPKPVLFRDLAGGGKKPAEPYGEGVQNRPVWQIVNIWEASPVFERLLFHPVIVKAISDMTGFKDLQVWHDQVQYKPAGQGGATGWHQDAPLWPSIEPMTPVSAWIPMDDADVDNGCMWMVPGSHRWGNQQPHLATQGHLRTLAEFPSIRPADPSQQVVARACPVKRCEVHFHHSLTWHGSPENHSNRPRRAVAIHYMTSEARFTGRDHPMKQFIEVEVGGPMLKAGSHFPIVCRDGQPVAPPKPAAV